MLIALVLISAVNAVAAGNIVPITSLDEYSRPTTTADFTPAQCSAIAPVNIVTGAGLIVGTAGDDLILGSNSGEWIFGLGGDDCILGGGGDDLILAGAGTDVCIGGNGNDTFNQCETQNQ
jgi:Ca2+-binding RTX toxin-like protein